MIPYTDLPDVLVKSDRVLTKIQELLITILQMGDNESMSREELVMVIAKSAFGLGVEEAQRQHLHASESQVRAVRNALDSIDKLLQDAIDELDVISGLRKLRKEFADALAERAQVLTGAIAQQASEMYDIDIRLITGDTDPKDMDNAILESAGFVAYQKRPVHFFGWWFGVVGSYLGEMKCKCTTCLVRRIDKDFSSATELNAAIAKFGGIGPLYREFGLFLLNTLREELMNELEGCVSSDGHFSEDSEDAKAVMEKALNAMRAKKE